MLYVNIFYIHYEIGSRNQKVYEYKRIFSNCGYILFL